MNENTELSHETDPVGECWNLKLYIAGQTPKSVSAFNNLKRLCDQHHRGKYKLEIIDLLANPHLAQADQIVAIPTLIRQLPAPIRKIIGDLSNSEKTLRGLDLTVQPLPEEISDGRR